MSNRVVLSLAIVMLLVTSVIPFDNETELSDDNSVFKANSEPELLISAGTSTGHVNGTAIGASPNGWIVAGDTRNSLSFGSFQLQALSLIHI